MTSLNDLKLERILTDLDYAKDIVSIHRVEPYLAITRREKKSSARLTYSLNESIQDLKLDLPPNEKILNATEFCDRLYYQFHGYERTHYLIANQLLAPQNEFAVYVAKLVILNYLSRLGNEGTRQAPFDAQSSIAQALDKFANISGLTEPSQQLRLLTEIVDDLHVRNSTGERLVTVRSGKVSITEL